MADEFSSCFEVELIEKVEQFPWIWDTSRHDYRDKIKRENSWKNISNLLSKYSFLNVCLREVHIASTAAGSPRERILDLYCE